MNEKRLRNLKERNKIKTQMKSLKNVSRETQNIVVPDYDPKYIYDVGYYTRPQKGHVHPFYMTNADYNTDSASYYDYLAKFNDLLQALIDQVNDNTKNIDLIFDMLDDIQDQIDVINIRLDLIEDDINNIYDLIDEINNQLDLIWEAINNIPTIPEVATYVVYNNNGNEVYYPENGFDEILIPIPDTSIFDYQSIGVIWGDVRTNLSPATQSMVQQNQYTHNGSFLKDLNVNVTKGFCTDVIGSQGSSTAYVYAYAFTSDYKFIGGTASEFVYNDVGLLGISVAGGLPVKDLTTYELSLYTDKQRELLLGGEKEIINKAYECWLNIGKYSYGVHNDLAGFLTSYLNDKEDEETLFPKIETYLNTIIKPS